MILTRCPHCGYRADVHSMVGSTGPRLPTVGDLTICIGCGAWAFFEADFIGLRLRKPTPAETVKLDASPKLAKVRAAWDEMDQERARGR